MNKDIEYYMNLNWTLIEGTDLDFNGNPYWYIEIKEISYFNQLKTICYIESGECVISSVLSCHSKNLKRWMD